MYIVLFLLGGARLEKRCGRKGSTFSRGVMTSTIYPDGGHISIRGWYFNVGIIGGDREKIELGPSCHFFFAYPAGPVREPDMQDKAKRPPSKAPPCPMTSIREILASST